MKTINDKFRPPISLTDKMLVRSGLESNLESGSLIVSVIIDLYIFVGISHGVAPIVTNQLR